MMGGIGYNAGTLYVVDGRRVHGRNEAVRTYVLLMEVGNSGGTVIGDALMSVGFSDFGG
ncbi:MAG: hypothetical protein ACLRSW_10955 [Christensenellaceae bacterium]